MTYVLWLVDKEEISKGNVDSITSYFIANLTDKLITKFGLPYCDRKIKDWTGYSLYP